ncbi:hypothetical protein P7C73_g2743, partial [Tremellales sp. Uapishka_1]
MGNLVWHQWGRLLALASASYLVWASFWAFFYRKFFWDMIGGTLGPAGIMFVGPVSFIAALPMVKKLRPLSSPGSNSTIFVDLIVKIPLLQIFTLLHGIIALALEYPLPFIKGTSVHRSFLFRVVFYPATALVAIMIYQGTNPAIYLTITSLVYLKAMMNGEEMELSPRRNSEA